jgi:hypothetical protein
MSKPKETPPAPPTDDPALDPGSPPDDPAPAGPWVSNAAYERLVAKLRAVVCEAVQRPTQIVMLDGIGDVLPGLNPIDAAPEDWDVGPHGVLYRQDVTISDVGPETAGQTLLAFGLVVDGAIVAECLVLHGMPLQAGQVYGFPRGAILF